MKYVKLRFYVLVAIAVAGAFFYCQICFGQELVETSTRTMQCYSTINSIGLEWDVEEEKNYNDSCYSSQKEVDDEK